MSEWDHTYGLAEQRLPSLGQRVGVNDLEQWPFKNIDRTDCQGHEQVQPRDESSSPDLEILAEVVAAGNVLSTNTRLRYPCMQASNTGNVDVQEQPSNLNGCQEAEQTSPLDLSLSGPHVQNQVLSKRNKKNQKNGMSRSTPLLQNQARSVPSPVAISLRPEEEILNPKPAEILQVPQQNSPVEFPNPNSILRTNSQSTTYAKSSWMPTKYTSTDISIQPPAALMGGHSNDVALDLRRVLRSRRKYTKRPKRKNVAKIVSPQDIAVDALHSDSLNPAQVLTQKNAKSSRGSEKKLRKRKTKFISPPSDIHSKNQKEALGPAPTQVLAQSQEPTSQPGKPDGNTELASSDRISVGLDKEEQVLNSTQILKQNHGHVDILEEADNNTELLSLSSSDVIAVGLDTGLQVLDTAQIVKQSQEHVDILGEPDNNTELLSSSDVISVGLDTEAQVLDTVQILKQNQGHADILGETDNTELLSSSDISINLDTEEEVLLDPAEILKRVQSAANDTEILHNFLRCLHIFNQNFIEADELYYLTKHMLNGDPELLDWFRSFLKEPTAAASSQTPTSVQVLELDYKSCLKVGASYRQMPANSFPAICSGRTALCDSVLNDTYVGCSEWFGTGMQQSLHDAHLGSFHRNGHEDALARVEDQRFELDMIICSTADLITHFEHINQMMKEMAPEELATFKLDNRLGGTSEFLFRAVLDRIYGPKTNDLVKALKSFPAKAIVLVLARLKAKVEEWQQVKNSKRDDWAETMAESNTLALAVKPTARRMRRRIS